MAEAFQFELVSPERLLVSEMVESVIIPGSEGEMTIMAHHAPVMTTIKPGVVTVNPVGGAADAHADRFGQRVGILAPRLGHRAEGLVGGLQQVILQPEGHAIGYQFDVGGKLLLQA